MMQQLKHLVVSFALIMGGFGAMTVLAAPSAYADGAEEAAATKDCSSNFLGFPAWYDGLTKSIGSEPCAIMDPSEKGGIQNFIFAILLNIIEIGLRLVGYAAVGYVIYGGFKYLTAAGSADRITAGRKIIMNALIGLAISIMSIGIVNLIASNLK